MIIPNNKDENSEEKVINLESIKEQLDREKPKVIKSSFTDTYQFQNLSVCEFKRERFDRYSYMSRVKTMNGRKK